MSDQRKQLTLNVPARTGFALAFVILRLSISAALSRRGVTIEISGD